MKSTYITPNYDIHFIDCVSVFATSPSVEAPSITEDDDDISYTEY